MSGAEDLQILKMLTETGSFTIVMRQGLKKMSEAKYSQMFTLSNLLGVKEQGSQQNYTINKQRKGTELSEEME